MNNINWFVQKQAEKNAMENALRLAQAEHLRPEKKPYLDESRPLTGTFSDYVTQDTEPRYKCDRFGYVQHIDMSSPMSDFGVDIDQFRKDCEEIDRE